LTFTLDKIYGSRTKKHLLKDILVIAILAVIAGAQGWEDMLSSSSSKFRQAKSAKISGMDLI
jgi:hypothetical protein